MNEKLWTIHKSKENKERWTENIVQYESKKRDVFIFQDGHDTQFMGWCWSWSLPSSFTSISYCYKCLFGVGDKHGMNDWTDWGFKRFCVG